MTRPRCEPASLWVLRCGPLRLPEECLGAARASVRSLYGGGGHVQDNFWFEGSDLVGKGFNIQAMLIGGTGTGLDTYALVIKELEEQTC
jgi:hypothetical protein